MVKIFEENHPNPGSNLSAAAPTAAAAAKSAIGIIGTLGSSYLRKASSGGGGGSDEADQLGGSSHGGASSLSALKEQIRDLTKQVLELKHLEKAKGKIEELERRAAEAEMHTQKAQEFCLSEVNAVNGRLQVLQLKFNEAVTEKEQAQAELAKLRKQWSKESKAQSAAVTEAAELRSQLDAARAKLSEAEARLIDPIVVSKLEEKMHEVTGMCAMQPYLDCIACIVAHYILSLCAHRLFVTKAEKAHWQKKAQSLSKDMQRVLGSAGEADQLRAKVSELQMRNEV
jgi:multidrug efflux pump subunit AcrA (membrane-fusion protein)